MYLEKLRNNKVSIYTNSELCSPTFHKNYIHTRVFKLTELAKCLGASEVRVINGLGDFDNGFLINFIDEEYTNSVVDFLHQSAEMVLDMFWDDCNEALTLESIWDKGKEVGYFTYENNEGVPSDVLKEEEYRFFDIRSSNYDFTISGKEFSYKMNEEGALKRIDE